MTDVRQPEEPSCDGQCHCCRIGAILDRAEGPRGWRLAGGAAGLFLAPLALAITGAFVGGPGAGGEALGALVGFFAGLAGGVIVSRWCQRRSGQAVACGHDVDAS